MKNKPQPSLREAIEETVWDCVYGGLNPEESTELILSELRKRMPKKKIFLAKKGFVGLTDREAGYNQAISDMERSLS